MNIAELRAHIEDIKTRLTNTGAMRDILEDLLTTGECYILLKHGVTLRPQTIVEKAECYLQKIPGLPDVQIRKDAILHLQVAK
jgi:hypothetical protein